jgi:hypothetical protein
MDKTFKLPNGGGDILYQPGIEIRPDRSALIKGIVDDIEHLNNIKQSWAIDVDARYNNGSVTVSAELMKVLKRTDGWVICTDVEPITIEANSDDYKIRNRIAYLSNLARDEKEMHLYSIESEKGRAFVVIQLAEKNGSNDSPQNQNVATRGILSEIRTYISSVAASVAKLF